MIKLSDKNKLQKIELQQNISDNSIRDIDDKNSSINNKVLEVNSKLDIFCKLVNLNKDWTECTKIYNLSQANPIWQGEQLIEWTVDLGQIDIRLLPFLKIDIVYKLNLSTIVFNVVGLKNKFFEYKDTNLGEYIKEVMLHACLYFSQNVILREMNPVKAKLLVVWDEIPLIKHQTYTADSDFDILNMTLVGWQNGKPESSNPVWPNNSGESGGGVVG